MQTGKAPKSDSSSVSGIADVASLCFLWFTSLWFRLSLSSLLRLQIYDGVKKRKQAYPSAELWTHIWAGFVCSKCLICFFYYQWTHFPTCWLEMYYLYLTARSRGRKSVITISYRHDNFEAHTHEKKPLCWGKRWKSHTHQLRQSVWILPRATVIPPPPRLCSVASVWCVSGGFTPNWTTQVKKKNFVDDRHRLLVVVVIYWKILVPQSSSVRSFVDAVVLPGAGGVPGLAWQQRRQRRPLLWVWAGEGRGRLRWTTPKKKRRDLSKHVSDWCMFTH